MKIEIVTVDNKNALLELMHESHDKDGTATPTEWQQTQAAINTLLDDPQAGEAYLLKDAEDIAIGYIIMCRGFSLEYGGYFTWIEETYLRQSGQGRFRDKRFAT